MLCFGLPCLRVVVVGKRRVEICKAIRTRWSFLFVIICLFRQTLEFLVKNMQK